jgi:prepilin-type N-terminal cleavage/methylation domain-containing protein
MPAIRRARAFTLIEAMIVVAIVGILALVAAVAYRKWILNSYMGEAQDMLGNIRSAEETFRAENTGYLTVSPDLTSAASLYPMPNPTGNSVTAWGAALPQAWATLNVNPSAPVHFGYAVVADNNGTVPLPAITNNGVAVNLAPMQGQPWYVAVAICDLDSDSTTPNTTIYAMSGTNQLLVNNAGQ